MVRPIAFWRRLAHSGLIPSQAFQIYCHCFCGYELWRPSDVAMNKISVSWKNAVQRVWALPYRTHGTLLPHLILGVSAFDLFVLQSTSFTQTNALISNQLLSQLVQITRFNVNFLAGFILTHINFKFSTNYLHRLFSAVINQYDNIHMQCAFKRASAYEMGRACGRLSN